MSNFQNGSMVKKIIYLLSPHQRRQSWPGSDMLCQWRRFLLNDPCSHKDNTSLDSDSSALSVADFGKEAREKREGEKTCFNNASLCYQSVSTP